MQSRSYAKPLAGLATLLVICFVVFVSLSLFLGYNVSSVPVVVVAPRAGLVMNPEAKVKMRGVQVGTVASIEHRADGKAVLRLAMHPDQMSMIPSNVLVDISSASVFGSKFVEFIPPAVPSLKPLSANQVLEGEHVTVEFNTVFQQLNSLFSSIDPAKLNQTLGAVSTAVNGRGEKIGQTISNLNSYLAQQESVLPALSHNLEQTPAVANAYADAASDLATIISNSSEISTIVVDEQRNLDAFLLSSIGLANAGIDVVGGNRQALTDSIHLLRPTTDLFNQYRQAVFCGASGSLQSLTAPTWSEPMIKTLTYFAFAPERYRYPGNLPKVMAQGGSQCFDLPNVPFDHAPPFVVTDVGANPQQYGNQQLLLNSDALKQMLYGPIDGPPRNSLQLGQPG